MIKLEKSRYGNPLPTYYLAKDFAKTAKHRELKAAVYELAALIERATPAGEKWIVIPNADHACVSIALDGGDPRRDDEATEAKRAMDVLRSVERA